MSCCPRLSDNRELLRAARCLLNQEDALTSDCAQSPTAAKGVRALGLNCTLVTDRDWPRGFFLIARTAAGTDVCTSGDTLRVTAVETQQRVRFSGYARAVSDGQRQNNIYWADLTGAAEPLVGRHTFVVTASLLETQNRSLQAAEARGPLRWSVDGGSPIREWFRYRLCVGQAITLSRNTSIQLELQSSATYEGSAAQSRCRGVRPNASTAMVNMRDGDAHIRECGTVPHLCTGNASALVINTFRGPKDEDRLRNGFHHILKPAGCRYHWFNETELTRCLAGRSVLNIGGSTALSVQRGFERLSSNLVHKRTWWFDYGRTGVSNNHDEATGRSQFGSSTVRTQFIHHPFRYGLTNVLAPGRDVLALKSAAEYEKLMCLHDIVIFESGLHDFSTPDKRAHEQLLAACGQSQPCTDNDLMRLIRNESWRLDPIASYQAHLTKLMGMWQRCNESRFVQSYQRKRPLKPFRPIFKLAVCPNPATELRSCNADWGYNSMGHYLFVANQVARQIVEASGFEVFDTFPALLHAAPRWYDEHGKHALHADQLSDLVTQMLINQLCEDPA